MFSRKAKAKISNLKKIIKVYNNCELSSETQISDRKIEKSLKPDEKVKFGLSLGFMNLKNNYDKLIAVDNDNLLLTSVGAIVFFNSNMLKYNDLNFNISIDYFLKGQQRLENSESALLSQIQFIKSTFGVRYKFANLKTKIKPYIGTSVGLIFHNSKSSLRSKTAGSFIINYNHNNAFIYSINTGIVCKIFNKDIDFLIEYQPSLNSSLFKKSDLDQRNSSYTFSSLNSDFINEYKDTLNRADTSIVYFSKTTLESKKMQKIDFKDIVNAFNNSGLIVFDDPLKLKEYLFSLNYNKSVLLMMSSGSFGNIQFDELKNLLN